MWAAGLAGTQEIVSRGVSHTATGTVIIDTRGAEMLRSASRQPVGLSLSGAGQTGDCVL
jgi:hypothetical protein